MVIVAHIFPCEQIIELLFFVDVRFPKQPVVISSSDPFAWENPHAEINKAWHKNPRSNYLAMPAAPVKVLNDAPIAWWLLQFDQKYLFTGFLIDHQSNPSYKLSYMFDDGRQPTYYMEDGKVKVRRNYFWMNEGFLQVF